MDSKKDNNWFDIPLIADDKTGDYLSPLHPGHAEETPRYDAIALNDEHLYMWNMTLSEIRLVNKLRDIQEMRHPFWVDKHAIAHVIPEARTVRLKRNKRKYLTDNTTATHESEQIDYHHEITQSLDRIIHTINTLDEFGRYFAVKRSISERPHTNHDGSTIKIISANDISRILQLFPQKRLLLIDQYDMFTLTHDKIPENLAFKFTGAPVKGHLSEKKEQLFWQRLANQSAINKERLAHQLTPSGANNNRENAGDRQCSDIWYYFVPNTDHIEVDNTVVDFRIVDLHLMDTNDTLIWRNLMASFIENERLLTDSTSIARPEVVLIIKLRYCIKEAQERSNEKRMALKAKFKSNFEPEMHLKQRALCAAKLHFKRFSAFFMRAIQQRPMVPHTPRLYWTMQDDEQSVIHLIYQEIFRETLTGRIHNLIAYDRFLKLEPLFIHQHEPGDNDNSEKNSPRYPSSQCHLLISTCPVRILPNALQRSDNVLGIFQQRLLNNQFFSSDVYCIPGSAIYIERHRSQAPIYKLRQHEM